MTEPARAARALFESQRFAVLSTASAGFDGWPFGSVVPYVPLPDGSAAVVLADIAEHSKNLRRDPRGGLFVADDAARADPQAGARVALLVTARVLDGEAAEAAGALYGARFPQQAAMRGHGFRLWGLSVERVRWIAGFGAMGWLEREAWLGG